VITLRIQSRGSEYHYASYAYITKS